MNFRLTAAKGAKSSRKVLLRILCFFVAMSVYSILWVSQTGPFGGSISSLRVAPNGANSGSL